MSDLTAFRDHARAMAEAVCTPECVETRATRQAKYLDQMRKLQMAERYGPGWGEPDEPPIPPTACPGCVTDADRALWARLAAEVDDYLTPATEEGLFA